MVCAHGPQTLENDGLLRYSLNPSCLGVNDAAVVRSYQAFDGIRLSPKPSSSKISTLNPNPPRVNIRKIMATCEGKVLLLARAEI